MKHIVVVGNGMVGYKFCEKLVEKGSAKPTTRFENYTMRMVAFLPLVFVHGRFCFSFGASLTTAGGLNRRGNAELLLGTFVPPWTVQQHQ